MSKRKAFNFYLSYFDTAMMLNNSERLQFYDAIMQKQFNGIDPVGLKGVVNFAWVSQKHSIDAQVKGWEDKTKLSLQDDDNHTLVGGMAGGIEPPSRQEKGQEKEKEEVQEEIKKQYATLVNMLEKEFDKLVSEHGIDKTNWMIAVLDNYKVSKGKTYKEDYRAILSWVVGKAEKEYKSKSENTSTRRKSAEPVNPYDQFR